MNNFNAVRWIRFSVINLMIVALLGVIMRYKICYSFPFLSQKSLQQAHSNFAFIGWITHTIYVLLLDYLAKRKAIKDVFIMKTIIFINIFCSYGILVSLLFLGYGFLSAFFSTSIIIWGLIFSYFFFKELKDITIDPSIKWLKVGLLFNNISSIGIFYLVYILFSKKFNEQLFLSSLLYYLHFQYNGFFFFSCMGLFESRLTELFPNYKHNSYVFLLFFIASIPSYVLSILWVDSSVWLVIIAGTGGLIQLLGWFLFLKSLSRVEIKQHLKQNNVTTFLGLIIIIACTIKFFLQIGSAFPTLNIVVFGSRSIIIAYLHLVLLGMISMFLLTYLYSSAYIKQNTLTERGLNIFAIGVIINEGILAIQGITTFNYFVIPCIMESLFVVSLILLAGITLVVLAQMNK